MVSPLLIIPLFSFGVSRGSAQLWGMGSATFSTFLATGEHPHLAVAELVGVFEQVCTTADRRSAVVPFIRGYTLGQGHRFHEAGILAAVLRAYRVTAITS